MQRLQATSSAFRLLAIDFSLLMFLNRILVINFVLINALYTTGILLNPLYIHFASGKLFYEWNIVWRHDQNRSFERVNKMQNKIPILIRSIAELLLLDYYNNYSKVNNNARKIMWIMILAVFHLLITPFICPIYDYIFNI